MVGHGLILSPCRRGAVHNHEPKSVRIPSLMEAWTAQYTTHWLPKAPGGDRPRASLARGNRLGARASVPSHHKAAGGAEDQARRDGLNSLGANPARSGNFWRLSAAAIMGRRWPAPRTA